MPPEPSPSPRRPRRLRITAVVIALVAAAAVANGLLTRAHDAAALAKWTEDNALPHVSVATPTPEQGAVTMRAQAACGSPVTKLP